MSTDNDYAMIYDNAFCCPLCGSEINHLDTVELVTSQEGMVLSAGGEDEHARVTARPTPGRSVGRRHAIIIGGWCEECDHCFELVYRQAKGQTYTAVLDQGPAGRMYAEDAGR